MALVSLGKVVLIPWGEEHYDLVLDEGDRFVRVQCKTGTLRRASVMQVLNTTRPRDYEVPIPQVELVDLRGANAEVVDGDLVAVSAYQHADAAGGQGGIGPRDDRGAVDGKDQAVAYGAHD